MLSGALRRSTRRAVVQLPRRSFGGHGHAAPVAQPGDFVAKPPTSPSTVAFFGESLGGLITSTTSNGTFAALSSRGMWPWLAGFGATFWLVGKMGTSRTCNPPHLDSKMTREGRKEGRGTDGKMQRRGRGGGGGGGGGGAPRVRAAPGG
jgi:hypothetical protein